MVLTLVRLNGDFIIIGKPNTLIKSLAKTDNTWAIADQGKTTVHYIIKGDHFDILAKSKPDYHCKIKETAYLFKNAMVP